jgi:hypothetical protein
VIPFQTWFSQIVGYARFITDTPSIRRAWVEGDRSQTSVTDFDELYEQIFDDLDSGTFENDLAIHFPDDAAARQVLASFLREIRTIDALRSSNKELHSPAALLRSEEWSRLVEVAHRVVSMFKFVEDGA